MSKTTYDLNDLNLSKGEYSITVKAITDYGESDYSVAALFIVSTTGGNHSGSHGGDSN